MRSGRGAERLHRRGHGGTTEAELLRRGGDRHEHASSQQIVELQRGAGRPADGADAFAIVVQQAENLSRGPRGLIRRGGDALEEET